MDTKKLFSTLVDIVQPLMQPRIIGIQTRNLEMEIHQLTTQIKLQNSTWHRLLLGMVTGLGTALGATVITTIVIVIASFILKAVGIHIDLTPGA